MNVSWLKNMLHMAQHTTSMSSSNAGVVAREKARAADKKAKPKSGMTAAQKREFRKLYTPGERPRGPKAGSSTVSKIVKRAKTTAREARDVATAVGSAAQALRKSPQEGIPVKKTIKNIGTQVKETARAAATGKKGTTAYKVKPDPYSKEKRKAAGGKGFVFYDVTKPKKR